MTTIIANASPYPYVIAITRELRDRILAIWKNVYPEDIKYMKFFNGEFVHIKTVNELVNDGVDPLEVHDLYDELNDKWAAIRDLVLGTEDKQDG